MVGRSIPKRAFGLQEDELLKERNTYSFFSAVQHHFGFVAEYGFSNAFDSESRVLYQSKRAYIEVTHERNDGEVAISFGRATEKEKFSFTLFLRLKNYALEQALGERLAETPSEVEECLSKLSQALKTEGHDILHGNDAIFEQMKDVRWWHFRPEALKTGDPNEVLPDN